MFFLSARMIFSDIEYPYAENACISFALNYVVVTLTCSTSAAMNVVRRLCHEYPAMYVLSLFFDDLSYAGTALCPPNARTPPTPSVNNCHVIALPRSATGRGLCCDEARSAPAMMSGIYFVYYAHKEGCSSFNLIT